MGKFRARQNITIKCDSEADANKVFEYLSENHDEREYWDQFGARVEGSMDVTGYYDPPVYYSKNGDGNPALIDLEYLKIGWKKK